MDYAKTLKELALELVEDKANLKVVEMPSLEEDDVLLHVYASKKDISRLIGRKGMMANSIRQLMSVSGRLTNKRIDIKFESYGDE